ncbi:porin [Noviherbaspirillum denitrificans]|uniref:Porin n=1 Tax=Noviherbaspirillum denitrificans TaxID=1968433 RepID=A0A254TDC5_9BURK|nr:porin [Noviherbaspirillum denitrificans]OWW20650.1 porin [Noviherbaspirillum denitrificans]
MNKIRSRRIAAVALHLTAGYAMAQTNVNVSGLIDGFAGSLKNSGDTARRSVVGSGGMTTSWWGLKGQEDLGSGLRAEVALTGFMRIDTGETGRFGADNMFSQNANVGLSGSWGKVQLGRALAPNFLPNMLFNPFGDSFTFSPLIVHSNVGSGPANARTWSATNAGDTGWSNQVIYMTPEYGGLRGNFHYQLGEVAGDSGKRNIGGNLLYFNGPLGLSAYYQDVQVGNPNPGPLIDATTIPINIASIVRQKTWFGGASYETALAKMFATFRRSSNEARAGNAMEDRGSTIGLSAKLGQGVLLAAVGRAHRSGTLVGGGTITRTTASFGYDYYLSKRVDVYAVMMNDKITRANGANSVGFGIRHRF